MPGLYGGLGNYLIPIYVGSPEIIFPRLNNCSMVFTTLSLVLMLLALLTEYSIGPGWTLYPPLSLYPVNTTVLIILGLLISGLGTLITSINYVLTAFHTLILADLFVPAMIITALMLLFVLPVLTGGLLLIISDMYFNTMFWKGVINGNSGDPVLYQHIFWIFGQYSIIISSIIIWPFSIIIYLMNNAICWNNISFVTIYHFIRLNYINILSSIIASLVTIIVITHNQQVTYSNWIIDTSETLCIVSCLLLANISKPLLMSKTSLTSHIPIYKVDINTDISTDDNKFNEWLAGIIDGNATIKILKKDNIYNCSCEIQMNKYNEDTLLYIKNKIGGGTVKSKNNTFIYKCNNNNDMINIVNRINGNIRNNKRLPQFIKLCSVLNIQYISPITLSINNSWYSGFFDINGTFKVDFDHLYPYVHLSVTNSYQYNLDHFLFLFNGTIQYKHDNSGYYIWTLDKETDIKNMLHYFKLNPLRSHKSIKINLINQFYQLKASDSHYMTCRISYRNWTTLVKNWYKWEE